MHPPRSLQRYAGCLPCRPASGEVGVGKGSTERQNANGRPIYGQKGWRGWSEQQRGGGRKWPLYLLPFRVVEGHRQYRLGAGGFLQVVETVRVRRREAVELVSGVDPERDESLGHEEHGVGVGRPDGRPGAAWRQLDELARDARARHPAPTGPRRQLEQRKVGGGHVPQAGAIRERAAARAQLPFPADEGEDPSVAGGFGVGDGREGIRRCLDSSLGALPDEARLAAGDGAGEGRDTQVVYIPVQPRRAPDPPLHLHGRRLADAQHVRRDVGRHAVDGLSQLRRVWLVLGAGGRVEEEDGRAPALVNAGNRVPPVGREEPDRALARDAVRAFPRRQRVPVLRVELGRGRHGGLPLALDDVGPLVAERVPVNVAVHADPVPQKKAHRQQRPTAVEFDGPRKLHRAKVGAVGVVMAGLGADQLRITAGLVPVESLMRKRVELHWTVEWWHKSPLRRRRVISCESVHGRHALPLADGRKEQERGDSRRSHGCEEHSASLSRRCQLSRHAYGITARMSAL
eukprot:scaffold13984_cov117-Isochrysis_galbana.AAC.1